MILPSFYRFQLTETGDVYEDVSSQTLEDWLDSIQLSQYRDNFRLVQWEEVFFNWKIDYLNTQT